jgi:NAD(P) transhydrogenase subunit alpha
MTPMLAGRREMSSIARDLHPGSVMRIGIPAESAELERRVAAVPESVAKLVKDGFAVVVEVGAGAKAGYADALYEAAGATIGSRADALGAELVTKVRSPSLDEVAALSTGSVLICVLQPDRSPGMLDALVARGVTALALEKVPRVTRAQKMDVLSSMANLAGYRAVLEASAAFQGFFGPQTTAAGSTPPARVLVIGAGVAGLAAIAAARALGAEVRAFDTRLAAREQVESLGGKFLELNFAESGDGGGGYAKVMSKEFIDAEMSLFRAQAREVDVIITTALVPGTRAPLLVPRDVVECLKPGSIIVDMAAEQGGNCELTKADEIVVHNGVSILGYTDLTSRMANTASRFFANNIYNLVKEMRAKGEFTVDLENDVIRPAVITHGGEVLPAVQPAAPAPAPKSMTGAMLVPPGAKPVQQQITSPTRAGWTSSALGFAAVLLLFFASRFAPQDFLQHSTVFVLACFVGWQVVWSVTPALHTPLMSVTNAISGIIIIGGLLQIGSGTDAASILGAIAVLLAAINVAGGFLVTRRMLAMFRSDKSAPASAGHGGHGGAR